MKKLCFTLLVLGACEPTTPPQNPGPTATKAGWAVQSDGRKCAPAPGERRLLVEPSLGGDVVATAAEVDALMRDGAVVVIADDCGFDVLRDCFAEGVYSFEPGGAREELSIDDATGVLVTTGTRRIEVVPTRGALLGRCEGATHVLAAAEVGALALRRGDATAFQHGDPGRCAGAEPSDGCDRLVRLTLAPLGDDGGGESPAKPLGCGPDDPLCNEASEMGCSPDDPMCSEAGGM
jgi:hypothetical protein